jgi:formylmethanofuran dehydrogenase subunit A
MCSTAEKIHKYKAARINLPAIKKQRKINKFARQGTSATAKAIAMYEQDSELNQLLKH